MKQKTFKVFEDLSFSEKYKFEKNSGHKLRTTCLK